MKKTKEKTNKTNIRDIVESIALITVMLGFLISGMYILEHYTDFLFKYV